VPRVDRRATVTWEGNLARGEGRISAPSGAFSESPYSAATRIAARAETTSPEELLAAAHAGCFAMSLAGELRDPDARLDVTANVVLDEIDGQGHRIVESQLTVRVKAANLGQEELDRAVEAADAGCPFSRLIAAGAKVTIDARLEG
jgi:lipoyl-dependent peroxiredoxin